MLDGHRLAGMDSTYQARWTRMVGSNDLKLPNDQNAVPELLTSALFPWASMQIEF